MAKNYKYYRFYINTENEDMKPICNELDQLTVRSRTELILKLLQEYYSKTKGEVQTENTDVQAKINNLNARLLRLEQIVDIKDL